MTLIPEHALDSITITIEHRRDIRVPAWAIELIQRRLDHDDMLDALMVQCGVNGPDKLGFNQVSSIENTTGTSVAKTRLSLHASQELEADDMVTIRVHLMDGASSAPIELTLGRPIFFCEEECNQEQLNPFFSMFTQLSALYRIRAGEQLSASDYRLRNILGHAGLIKCGRGGNIDVLTELGRRQLDSVPPDFFS